MTNDNAPRRMTAAAALVKGKECDELAKRPDIPEHQIMLQHVADIGVASPPISASGTNEQGEGRALRLVGVTGVAYDDSGIGVGFMRGRMVRVTGVAETVLYAVAEPDAFLAMEIVRTKVIQEGEHMEDMGRVTEGLIAALQLRPGEFKRV
jgi:hypothetical protein